MRRLTFIKYLPTGLALAFASFSANAAGFLRIEQTIFGMDCAPCAHATEQALKTLPGVQEVVVSLNRGEAVLTLAPDSTTTLSQVREAIRDHGFTPKAAAVSVVGKLEADGDALNLSAGVAGSFSLQPANGGTAWATLQQLADGADVRIMGEIAEEPGASPRLSVTAAGPLQTGEGD